MNVNLSDIALSKNAWGQLVLSLPDRTQYEGIEPIRCFPLSDPEGTISLIDADGHELFNLPNSDVLNTAAKAVLDQELTEREFFPLIQRINSTSTPSPPCWWTVETDRGPTGFQLESEDDVRRLGSNGAVIADSNGIRYKIPDINSLDSHSQRIVRRIV